jgi:hypothetical protein
MSETLAANSNISHYRILQKLGADGNHLLASKGLVKNVNKKIAVLMLAFNDLFSDC